MSDFIENYDIEKATDFMRENAGAVIVVDGEADCYKCLARQGIFTDFIEYFQIVCYRNRQMSLLRII